MTLYFRSFTTSLQTWLANSIQLKVWIPIVKGHNMKKVSIFTILLFIILVLSACGNSNSNGNSSTTSSVDGTISITPAMELAVGTLRLEGTSQAVDQELAVQLLPYWQLMAELNSNDAAAPEEISAVVENIQAMMTTEQVNAIQDMQLDQSDVTTAIQTTGSTSEVSNTNTNSNIISQAPVGGGPGGGPPDGGGMPMDGGGIGGGSIINSSSGQSVSSSQSSSTTNTTSLIEQVIKLLENRIKN
jgi:hypothetical protein